MADNYIYPAILNYEEGGITVEFPDLPGCITFGETEEEALKNAKEALEGFLYFMEEDNDIIPNPSKILDIQLEKNQIATLVNVWMIPVRDQMKNKSVKKTLTIPKWLNDIAEDNNVNFSQVLQSSLKKYLGL